MCNKQLFAAVLNAGFSEVSGFNRGDVKYYCVLCDNLSSQWNWDGQQRDKQGALRRAGSFSGPAPMTPPRPRMHCIYHPQEVPLWNSSQICTEHVALHTLC